MGRPERNFLTFEQQVRVREWMIANHKYICDSNLSRVDTAIEARKALGFEITEGNLGTILTAIPEDMKFPWQLPPRLPFEVIAEIKEQLNLLVMGIDEIEKKIKAIESKQEAIGDQFAQVRGLINEMDTKFSAMISAIRTNTVTEDEVKSLSNTVKGMQSSLHRCMEELGLNKLDSAIKHVSKTIMDQRKTG